MPRLSTLSKPTGLVDIEKNRITIITDEAGKGLGVSVSFALTSRTCSSVPLSVVVVRQARECRGARRAWTRVETGDKSFSPFD